MRKKCPKGKKWSKKEQTCVLTERSQNKSARKESKDYISRVKTWNMPKADEKSTIKAEKKMQRQLKKRSRSFGKG
tara:strand:- start:2236 stop:2460 length:225 start_codon:yes stop_codon:yes gene_type:complete